MEQLLTLVQTRKSLQMDGLWLSRRYRKIYFGAFESNHDKSNLIGINLPQDLEV